MLVPRLIPVNQGLRMKPHYLIAVTLLTLVGCPHKAYDHEDPDAYAEYWSDPMNHKQSPVYQQSEECYENKDALCEPD